MKTLEMTKEQLEFCKQYTGLIETVNEALDYVVASFSDFEKTEGDVVLNDVIQAFVQIAQSHVSLEVLFQDDKEVVQGIQSFSNVLNQLERLEGKMDDLTLRSDIITNDVAPAYRSWSTDMLSKLQPYITV
ncbi:hypothetical protein [Falsibacillus pallidus]|uniref:DUF8042 domain-containing protein n=1 Tax=Falsibacillus pallidus TaxID=493781 RepID=A0A370GA84_9BACI|nr:hypothetical protein [Falsibacillus pallidus]RDI40110.1 hypothetical protein DFR59_11226 [Falsibacillus pallidus]